MKNNSEIFLVGITGGIGAGKSLVCKIFHHLGIPVYSSDNQAKHLMTENKKLKNEIIKNFGMESYSENDLNKSYLSESVFDDNLKLSKLNTLVHPFVKKDFLLWIKRHNTYDYLIKESALLIDSGSYKE